jgi:hypothetical protein
MSNINWKTVTIGLASFAAIIIVWLLIDKEESAKEISDLKKKIQEQEDLDDQIKSRLKQLAEANPHIDPKIASELKNIAELIAIKQETKAIATLAKIIENLLKHLYKKDSGLKELAKKNGRKSPVFADYLQYAKEKGIISSEDFHLVSVLKIIRNEEAHELDIKKEKSRISAAFIAGFAIVMSLCPLVRALTVDTKNEVLTLEKKLNQDNIVKEVSIDVKELKQNQQIL